MKPAYESEELELTEAERISARLDERIGGALSEDELLKAVERNDYMHGILEAALLLPLDGYRRVEAAVKAKPKPQLPSRRRARR